MNIPRASIWPTVTFDTTTPDGMAAAEAWARELVGEEPDRPEFPWRHRNDVWIEISDTSYSSWAMPPPKPGSHESDLIPGGSRCLDRKPGWYREYRQARRWSRANTPTEETA